MDRSGAKSPSDVVPTATTDTDRAIKIAAQNGASVETSVDGLTLPTIRVKIENGELVFRDYATSVDPSGKCVTLAQVGGAVNTSVTLCQGGERSIQVTGIGTPSHEVASQVALPPLPSLKQREVSNAGGYPSADALPDGVGVTGFAPEEERFLAVFSKEHFDASKRQFAELLKSGADFEAAVKVGKGFTGELFENQKKIDELNQQLELAEEAGGAHGSDDSRVKERNALEESNKQIGFKLDGTERYLAHLMREANGAVLQARVDSVSPSGDSQHGENAAGEASTGDFSTETNFLGRSRGSSWNSDSRDIFSDIAKLSVAGAGYTSVSQVESAISDLRSKQDVDALSAAASTFNQIIKQHPEFAERVDRAAVAELAKCFAEFPNPNSPGNALRFLDTETIARLPLSGLGSLTSSEVRTIFALLRDTPPTTYADNGSSNALDVPSK